ncbi:MAG: serine protease [Solirubrobacteraceae bacterium]|nr:serine protease [Solirubrobacteraceae bacterium]
MRRAPRFSQVRIHDALPSAQRLWRASLLAGAGLALLLPPAGAAQVGRTSDAPSANPAARAAEQSAEPAISTRQRAFASRRPAAGPQGRVVGGTPTSIRAVPWQVSVWSRGGAEGGFDCGGAILDALTIVTAAHCVEGVPIGDDPWDGGLGVTAGISDLAAGLPTDDPQDQVVVDARVHPQWNPSKVRTAGDLAVLELESPLVLDGVTAKAIALPPDVPLGDQPVLVGTPTLVSGYGRQSFSAAPSGGLFSLENMVDLPSVCPADDNAAALCARTPVGAACSGDSGGPLVTRTSPPILVGIVSNGPADCPPGEGESYVNLSAPENRRFLAGSATPPIAPRLLTQAAFVTAGGVSMVGQPVVCTALFDRGSTTWTIKNDGGQLLATGTGGASFTYLPADGDVGRLLTCEVTASNAGGVSYSGPASTAGPVMRPRPSQARPPSATPFRLSEAIVAATAARSVKRGKLVNVTVSLSNLFGAAESATVCVKHGTAKPKCLAPSLKGSQGTALTFRFRVSKRARVKSLQKFAVSAVIAGRNPNSGLVEQVNRATSVRARVTR